MEVDLGIWSSELLFASSPDWSLLYARSAAQSAAVTHALGHNVPLTRNASATASGSDSAWQVAVSRATSALRRGDQALALAEAENAVLSDKVRRALRCMAKG